MNPTSPDDLALARAGDVAAFLRLVQPFDHELRGFVRRMSMILDLWPVG